jgi:hypothetical protein
LFSRIHAAGIDEPSRWICDRVAYAVARKPGVQVTDIFRVFTVDENFSEQLLESVRFANPAAAQARLRAAGLLPDDIGEL